VSPLELTFASPLPSTTYQTYLPLSTHTITKRGISLACGYEDMARLDRETQALGVSWLWNWQTDPPVFEGIESVPCVWSAAFIGRPLGGNSEWVIGFNEPDQWDQANLTPEAGARTRGGTHGNWIFCVGDSDSVLFVGACIRRQS
jgi:hypothetical protein